MNLRGLVIVASLVLATPTPFPAETCTERHDNSIIDSGLSETTCSEETAQTAGHRYVQHNAALARSPTTSYTLWYDAIYDKKSDSLGNVACSSGEYGLLTAGYNVFGDLPSFPFIGGAPQIQSWDSPNCGTCWELTYINAQGITISLSFTAINTAPQPQGGFSISLEGMNRLMSGNAQTLDGVSITATQLQASDCGLL